MATQVIGVGRRSRVYAALVAVALTLAVFVVVGQASSIWSARNISPAQPAYVAPAKITGVNGSHISHSCRPKYGCDHNGRSVGAKP
jgi:hypothetical protein